MNINNIKKTSYNLLILLVSFTILFTIFGYHSDDWNGIDEENDKTLTEKLFNRFYFSIISASTIGLGDISPRTLQLKIIMIIYAFLVLVPIYNLFLS
tara:strand:- start:1366 stop:1656 length:291 start_codon:yes stop_codon:yes gene_type:complete